jgi:hypothetical protein
MRCRTLDATIGRTLLHCRVFEQLGGLGMDAYFELSRLPGDRPPGGARLPPSAVVP